jgi:hypothetical protein
MALFVFFLLETTRHLLRIEPLGDELVVFLVVLLRPLCQNFNLGRLLLLVADAYHQELQVILCSNNFIQAQTPKGQINRDRQLLIWQRSYEAVLGRVVGSTVEDVDSPVFEDAQLLSEHEREEPPALWLKY